MTLPHSWRLPRSPLAMVIAEGGVAKTVGVLLEIFDVKQLKRHPWPAQLLLDVLGWRQRRTIRYRSPHSVETFLQLCLVELGKFRVLQAGVLRTRHRRPHNSRADPQRRRDLPVGQPLLPLQS